MLQWIDEQLEELKALVVKWGNINTHSYNLSGLKTLEHLLCDDFSCLGATQTLIPLSHRDTELGTLIKLKKRPDAACQILFVGHYDTVHSPESGFLEVVETDSTTLVGPGITDMKAGLAIMLKALEAFEQTVEAKKVGWTILLTPDEEIGSLASKDIIQQEAKKANVGLVFEPCLPNGNMVSERVGSSNITVTVKGTPAHAGRDFKKGKSAIHALTDWIVNCKAQQKPDTIFNVGILSGGSAPNVVAEHAQCVINIRSTTEKELLAAIDILKTQAEKYTQDGLSITVDVVTVRAPKPFDVPTQALFAKLRSCAETLGLTLNWEKTGGVCDGNHIAAVGTPAIDTLGALGYGIHTSDETLHVPSLVEKTKLTALLLRRLGL